MRKAWNAPNIEELTIQSTACWYQGWQPSRPSKPGRPGRGDDDKCRCEGGISPCNKHHGFYPPFDSEDETSSF